MRRKLLTILISLIILLSIQIPLPACAQTNFHDLTSSQVQQLTAIKYSLTTVDDLESRGVLSVDLANLQRKYYLTNAQTLLSSPVAPEQLTALLKNYDKLHDVQTLSIKQRIAGFFTFVNIIWFASSILLVIAIGWLVALYLLPILFAIPPGVYEIIIYAVCLTSIVGGREFASGIAEFIALPGCLGLIGALTFSEYLHRKALQQFYEESKIDRFSLYSLILFCIWAAVAIAYNSVTIAFLSVISLETFLGFSVLVMPLCYFIGFRERKVIPRTTAASFLLLVFYVGLKITQTDIAYLNIFSSGALFMGAFVYFIGLLILSSKWHGHNNLWHYVGLQILTIVSGVAAIFIGSVWHIAQLQGIGGTFLFLYLLEKYWELPWKKQSWAWATLGLAVLLYLSSLIVRMYPQYFLFSV
ncbi:hypothetical protein F7734_13285 [Scytonema sp. UIC 10036]|uniref:hypothetical protein n=1 Tax=Scytonema sp. UIC 10036 TaxID=2304196 RepID=UPI0012DA8CAF|nr:hypothetical protein [Scytonema sp. UIC 10036]MUG93346.1 hypothetical protein [Scytonema sp. UIC 10036]